MSWFERLFGSKESSSSVAKRRLQMVLIHDRSDISPAVIEQVRDDIVAVLAKRLSIDPDNVVVNLNQGGQQNYLVAEIPLVSVNGRTRK